MATLSPPAVRRQRDAGRTRSAIKEAAQKLFAQKGYSAAGVREIAAEAGVNPALVTRYFGSKEGLLRSVLEDVLKIDLLIAGDRADFGKRVVRIFLESQSNPSPVALLLLATADPMARAMCQDMLHTHIVIPLAQWLGGPDAEERATQLNIMWIGFMAGRQTLALPTLSDERVEPIRKWLETATQALVDEQQSDEEKLST